jgi:stress response protein YsnF
MVEQVPVEVIPLVEERVSTHKQELETGRVRVRTVTEEREALVKEQLVKNDVQVVRVPKNLPIDAIPEPRHEGDILIIPVVVEELVVEKRLILKEEVHVQRTTSVAPYEQSVRLKTQRAIVEREQIEPQYSETSPKE